MANYFSHKIHSDFTNQLVGAEDSENERQNYFPDRKSSLFNLSAQITTVQIKIIHEIILFCQNHSSKKREYT